MHSGAVQTNLDSMGHNFWILYSEACWGFNKWHGVGYFNIVWNFWNIRHGAFWKLSLEIGGEVSWWIPYVFHHVQDWLIHVCFKEEWSEVFVANATYTATLSDIHPQQCECESKSRLWNYTEKETGTSEEEHQWHHCHCQPQQCFCFKHYKWLNWICKRFLGHEQHEILERSVLYLYLN